jgi:hypothetical protein
MLAHHAVQKVNCMHPAKIAREAADGFEPGSSMGALDIFADTAFFGAPSDLHDLYRSSVAMGSKMKSGEAAQNAKNTACLLWPRSSSSPLKVPKGHAVAPTRLTALFPDPRRCQSPMAVAGLGFCFLRSRPGSPFPVPYPVMPVGSLLLGRLLSPALEKDPGTTLVALFGRLPSPENSGAHESTF